MTDGGDGRDAGGELTPRVNREDEARRRLDNAELAVCLFFQAMLLLFGVGLPLLHILELRR